MKIKSIVSLILCIALCQAVGGLGAIFTTPEIAGWYATIQKPSFNPPNWIFAPVWTTLFVLMGVSLWLTFKSENSSARKAALLAFAIQLVLNSAWSFLFFKMHSLLAGLIEIFFLWLAILFWIVKTYPVSKAGALISIPYLLWVSFASFLNFWIWKLNA